MFAVPDISKAAHPDASAPRVKVWEKAGCNLAVVGGTMPVEALYAANDRLKASGGAASSSASKVDFKPGPDPRRAAHAAAAASAVARSAPRA